MAKHARGSLDAIFAALADPTRRAMTERLARAQAERERAEKRVATETARLPVYALDQSRNMAPTTAPAASRKRGSASCQEINARAQLGDISESDRDVLRNCR